MPVARHAGTSRAAARRWGTASTRWTSCSPCSARGGRWWPSRPARPDRPTTEDLSCADRHVRQRRGRDRRQQPALAARDQLPALRLRRGDGGARPTSTATATPTGGSPARPVTRSGSPRCGRPSPPAPAAATAPSSPHVLDALAAGAPPPVTLAQARPTMELVAAIYASAFTGRPVSRGEIGPGSPFYDRMDGTGAPVGGGLEPGGGVSDLRIEHDGGPSVSVHCGPARSSCATSTSRTDAQLESPRPYFHPMRTLGGDEVTLYRPHDHVWHKGLSLSLPNVGPENFWGGPTYLRERRLPAAAQQRDDAPPRRSTGSTSTPGRRRCAAADLGHRAGRDLVHRAARARRVHADPDADAWVLAFATRFVNVSDGPDRHRQPDHRGPAQRRLRRAVLARPPVVHRGLGARARRGRRRRSDGRPGAVDGVHRHARRPWRVLHRGDGRRHRTTPAHPTKWFVRSTPFACLCPAPFFDTEVALDPGEAVASATPWSSPTGRRPTGRARRGPAPGAATLEEWQ